MSSVSNFAWHFGVKLNYGYQEADDLHFACWVKISADNNLKLLFLFQLENMI